MNLGDVPHGAGLGVSLEVESAREGRQRGDVHPDATCRSSRTAQFGDVCNFEGSRQGLGAFGGPLTGGAGGSRYRSSSQVSIELRSVLAIENGGRMYTYRWNLS